ncbi:glycosyltransferase family A protein [Paenibacillus polymyxa]|uniref:glycosyltransferase family A protein n=1 Tax=Paenibacillus polymyxa TaxID=1406 RepID=UPI003D2B4F14
MVQKDKTAEIIDAYAKADHRIRVVHQENRKIPRTLSRGFKLAKGEYHTWTSADNILPEHFWRRWSLILNVMKILVWYMRT